MDPEAEEEPVADLTGLSDWLSVCVADVDRDTGSETELVEEAVAGTEIVTTVAVGWTDPDPETVPRPLAVRLLEGLPEELGEPLPVRDPEGVPVGVAACVADLEVPGDRDAVLTGLPVLETEGEIVYVVDPVLVREDV